jgi:hypothetical protein
MASLRSLTPSNLKLLPSRTPSVCLPNRAMARADNSLVLPAGYVNKFKELNLTVIPTPHWSQLAPYWKSTDNREFAASAASEHMTYFLSLRLPGRFGSRAHSNRRTLGTQYADVLLARLTLTLSTVSKAIGGVGGNELAVGSDWPVDAYDSFLEFKVAITRTGDPKNPHSPAYYSTAFRGKLNKLPAWTRDQALRGLTINPARWLKIDGSVGSLEVGKLADCTLRNSFYTLP